MKNKDTINEDDLVTNPTPRVPVCLCLDTSGSMAGPPISELDEGVRAFIAAVLGDDTAKDSAEIAVVTFGGDAEVKADFGPVETLEPPSFAAGGCTPMGDAVDKAVTLLEERKRAYAEAGVDYFQPWLVLMTDGAPTDSIERAATRVADLVERRRLSVFAIGIGETADLVTLARFTPKRPPLRLKGLAFPKFFEWLSKSVSQVAQSVPGQHVQLNTQGIAAWGTP
jgi:uncharacterized protein YegL